MRIWHVYLVRGLHAVNGVVSVITRVAGAHAALGHQVTVVAAQRDDGPFPGPLHGAVDVVLADSVPAAVAAAHRRLADDGVPDVVHFHEVLRPPHAVLARLTSPAPFVVSTHAGLFPENLRRYRWKKAPYGRLVERRFLRRASRVIGTCPVEERAIRSFLGDSGPPTASVPNPLEPELLPFGCWSPPERPARVVTLARYDVRHKGLDRLAAIAERLTDVEFVVHGRACHNEPRRLEALRRSKPPNLHLAPPVYGSHKARVLLGAALFVLPSRWDAVSEAMTEAMSLGVPTAVSRFIGGTLPFEQEELGLVLHDEPAVAARQIREALDDPERLRAWSAAGRRYALASFHPEVLARRLVEIYAEIRRDVSAAG